MIHIQLTHADAHIDVRLFGMPPKELPPPEPVAGEADDFSQPGEEDNLVAKVDRLQDQVTKLTDLFEAIFAMNLGK